MHRPMISVFLLMTATACGGGSESDSDSDDSGGSCSRQACGGDVVGTWQVEELCPVSTEELSFDGCPESRVDASGLTVTGSITFSGDGTVNQSLVLGGGFTFTVPETCRTYDGLTLTCAQVDQAARNSLAEEAAAGETPIFSSVSCSGGSNCSCTFDFVPQTESATGTYTISGSRITVVEPTSEVTTIDYCVDGDSATMAIGVDDPDGPTTLVLRR